MNLAYFALDPFLTLSSYSHWYRGSGSGRLPVIWPKSGISKRPHRGGREVRVFQPFSQRAGTCVQCLLPFLCLKLGWTTLPRSWLSCLSSFPLSSSLASIAVVFCSEFFSCVNILCRTPNSPGSFNIGL